MASCPDDRRPPSLDDTGPRRPGRRFVRAREALVDERERLTFDQLDAQVARAGRALVASGIQPGDRVAIWAPNCTEWVVAALGIFAAGGVLVPLNTRFKGAEARYVLERADVKLLFTVTDFLDTNYEALLRAEPELEELREIIDLRGPAWTEFLGRGTGAEALPTELGGDDLCAILFTSGTTGRPKGAMLTHGATVRAYDAWSTVVGLRAGDRYLVVNPFFHSFGLNAGIVASLVKGAAIIPHAVFDVDAVMARAAEEHVSMLPGPPTVYQSILDHPRLVGIRHVVAAPRGDRRGRGSRRARAPDARRARVRDHRHRLRPHRGDRDRDDVPPRRRSGDDCNHFGPGDSRRRGVGRRREERRGRRAASRARS